MVSPLSLRRPKCASLRHQRTSLPRPWVEVEWAEWAAWDSKSIERFPLHFLITFIYLITTLDFLLHPLSVLIFYYLFTSNADSRFQFPSCGAGLTGFVVHLNDALCSALDLSGDMCFRADVILESFRCAPLPPLVILISTDRSPSLTARHLGPPDPNTHTPTWTELFQLVSSIGLTMRIHPPQHSSHLRQKPPLIGKRLHYTKLGLRTRGTYIYECISMDRQRP